MKRLLLCAALVLGGCAANAQPIAQPLSPAEVRTLLPAHPLYGTLAQYDRQIAALRATLHTPQFAHASGDIDASISGLRSDLNAAAARINALVERRADAYAARVDAAASAILAGADASAPSQADVRAQVQRAYQAEYAQLRSGANHDMEAYRQALLAQQQHAYGEFLHSVQNRTQQAYAARAQELREQESALLLNLSRTHSAQRLQLQAKLQTLYLRPEQRAAYRARLQTLQRSEDAKVAALRRRDAGTLARYRDDLLAQADSAIAKMSAELTARTAANLAARRDVLAAQHAASAARLPSGAASSSASMPPTADLRARVSSLRENARKDFTATADATLSAYAGAQSDLAGRFGTLRDADRESGSAALAQIEQLRRDRDSLYREISSQIAEAERTERSRCRCENVTDAVRKDLQSLL